MTNQLPCGAVQFKIMYILLISPGYLLGLKILFLWRKKKLSLQGKESVTCLVLCILCKISYQHIMSHGGEGEMERERELQLCRSMKANSLFFFFLVYGRSKAKPLFQDLYFQLQLSPSECFIFFDGKVVCRYHK